MKTKKLSLVFIPLPAYFSALPTSQAVNPPPGGGYPGGNTAQGQNALLNLTSGTYNTAIGWFSINSNKIGSFDTAVGAGTLLCQHRRRQHSNRRPGAFEQHYRGASSRRRRASQCHTSTTANRSTTAGLQNVLRNCAIVSAELELRKFARKRF